MSNKIFIGDPEEDTVTEPTVVVDELEEKKEEKGEDKSSSRFSSFPIRGLNTLSGPKGEPSQHCPLNESLVPGSIPFRPRKSPFLHFGRNEDKVKKEEEQTETPTGDLDEKDNVVATTIVTEKPEETSTRAAFNPLVRTRKKNDWQKKSNQIPP